MTQDGGRPRKPLRDVFAALVRRADATTGASVTPAEVRDGLVALTLRTAVALTLAPGSGDEQALPTARLERVLADAAVWFEGPLLTTPTFTDRTLPFTEVTRLADWLDDATASDLLSALAPCDGAPDRDDVGQHYQALLELDVIRIDGACACLRPAGKWVRSSEILAEPKEVRSKWLVRHAGLPKAAVQGLAAPLATARTHSDVLKALSPLTVRDVEVPAHGALVVDASPSRRRSGSHYTPEALARAVIERTLSPLVADADADAVLALRICDPSMGTGAFLVEVAHFLAHQVASKRASARGLDSARGVDGDDAGLGLIDGARRDIVANCLYGVDQDPIAVDLARFNLARFAGAGNKRPFALSLTLRSGDAVGGAPFFDATDRRAMLYERAALRGPNAASASSFDWGDEFPRIRKEGGFHACVGNPPWVAYAGRAAQPLDEERAKYYERTNPAFFGYRTLHGLFVRRSAELLRIGGRLGLVIPTSVADLAGYAPTRRAHDALCEPDSELFDFGNGAFDGVFQPCMAVTSTRRHRAADSPTNDRPWRLSRTDLDEESIELLEWFARLPALAPALFGERGLQTTADDLARLRRLDAPEPPFDVPLLEGSDVTEFAVSKTRVFVDPRTLKARFRAARDWASVRVLIRQTARYPIAALSDGRAFRNSILAGFSSEDWTPHALVAYLNSSAVRWHHYMRHRDARQGMPQLKIGHLRAIPEVPERSARARLDALGRAIGARPAGLAPEEREALDEIVFDGFDLHPAARGLIRRWAEQNPAPKPRKLRRR